MHSPLQTAYGSGKPRAVWVFKEKYTGKNVSRYTRISWPVYLLSCLLITL